MLLEKIKSKSIIIKELIEENNGLKRHNYISYLGLSSSFFITLLLSIVSLFIKTKEISFIDFLLLNILCFLGVAIIIFILLFCINFFIKFMKISMNDYGEHHFFKEDIIVKRSRFLKVYNSYKSLSKNEKLFYRRFKNKKEIKIEFINAFCFEEEINNMSIGEFINYGKKELKLDIADLEIDKDCIIGNKILNILKEVDYKEFNNIKDDLIEVINKVEFNDKIKELNIFEKIEELKERYDEEGIENKINSIKNKVTKSSQEKNNKVLKSI
tara:strand:+ start:17173 stop:17982 length:810 start_codon:yes stop_codon:yes gene_type:complete